MSLYYLQKLLYDINRDQAVQAEFKTNRDALLARYTLTQQERDAVCTDAIGDLYILGVNGQILMHFAAWRGFEWDRYIAAMKEALARHGQVKAGIYAAVEGGGGGAV
jgi:Aromatic-ring-opening dioxygenase LigAB, LigA subunit